MKTLLSMSLMSFALALVGCGKSDESSDAPTDEDAGIDTQTKSDSGKSSKAPRTLVTGALLPTSAGNMLIDPGFSLIGSQSSQGQFIAFTGNGSTLDLSVRFDSASPIGARGSSLILKDPAATDSSSKAVTLLSSFVGGAPPLSTRVWLSYSTAAGDPQPFPEDPAAISVTISSGKLEGGYELQKSAAKPRVIEGRTWVSFEGSVATEVRGGFFLITTGTSGGSWLVAAPEIKAAEGNSVRSDRAALVRRPLRSQERDSITRYMAIPPNWGRTSKKPSLPE